MPGPRIQPMWMNLCGGAPASMPNVHRQNGEFGGIMEKIAMREKGEKDGEWIGVGDAGFRLSGRRAWRCKNHWNGVFCPK